MRRAAELEGVDGLGLPGGESTTISRLLRAFGLEETLRRRLSEGMGCLATCAGLIMLSRVILDGRSDQLALGAFDIAVRRNGYGRQVDSFETPVEIDGVADPFPAVFIRAPVIEEVGGDARVIARHDGKPVAVVQGPHIGLCFHPEMTNDGRIHRLFLERLARPVGAAVA